MSDAYVRIVRSGTIPTVNGEPAFAVRHDLKSPPGEGVFAQWAWDGATLRASNCRHGLYPLYYFATDTEVGVATSLMQLIEAGAPRQFDDAAIAYFLRSGTYAGDDTPFEAIRRLPPAGQLEWHRDGRWRVTGGPSVIAEQRMSRDDAIDAFNGVFRDAIRRRPPTHGALVPLSGGRDSRHVLFDLHAAGYAPETVTLRHFPPRTDRDAAVSRLLADALSVPLRIIDRPLSRVQAEHRVARQTDFSTDWHGWYASIADVLAEKPVDVYTGYGGDTLACGRSLEVRRLELWKAGDLAGLATDIHQKRPYRDVALRLLLEPEAYARFNRERAHARLVTELQRHVNQPNPQLSFTFQNALRRRAAPMWFRMCSDSANVCVPYLDSAVYDLLASLPADMNLEATFHTAAIHRAFPKFKDIPFAEGPGGWGADDPAHFRDLADETTEYVLSRQASQFANLGAIAERLSGPRHSGDGRYVTWLDLSRVLCLLRLEDALASASPPAGEHPLPSASSGWQPSRLDAHPALIDREANAAVVATALAAIIPSGSTFLLVDEGFLNTEPILTDRTCLRLAQSWTPLPEARLIGHVETLRPKVQFIVFAWPALWWLEFYPTLLERIGAASAMVHTGDGYVVYEFGAVARPSDP